MLQLCSSLAHAYMQAALFSCVVPCHVLLGPREAAWFGALPRLLKVIYYILSPPGLSLAAGRGSGRMG